ncbi:AMP-binding protein [Nocardioides sp.]|uniref:AMP-binding protein n=1 Tax=Nocardioides sp. TaxID=35761 RepID=UPI0035285E5F
MVAPAAGLVGDLLGRGRTAGAGVRVLTRAGVLRPYAPWTLTSLATTLLAWGAGPAGGFLATALREPDRTALVDDRGSLTFAELRDRSAALAAALADRGVGEGDRVAVLCRNHRGFVETTVAASLLGADLLYLNTAFSGPQLVELLARERPRLLVHDEEFVGLLEGDGTPRLRADTAEGESIDALVPAYPTAVPAAPDRRTRLVVLTSGTTGSPKGAPRSEAGLEAAVAMLDRIPLRFGQPSHVAAPLFHTWGFAHLAMSMLLAAPVVLRRQFDPEDWLRTVAEQDCRSVAVVPVMLQRVLQLPPDVVDRYDLSRLRVVASSGSALPPGLATRWMDRFGDTLYNLYGSTEVGYAGLATPRDLRAAPDTAGRPPYGTTVRILGEHGERLPAGERGRIFVGNGVLFEGYVGGGSKQVVDGLMSTGDIGHLDDRGRLFVDGREDDMVVSGGENLFPSEVERCLAGHPDVLDVAVVGVPDADWGQRLRAVVVLAGGVPSDAATREATEEMLRGWVRDRLARFSVPREVAFADELPRNATGKVLRSEL